MPIHIGVVSTALSQDRISPVARVNAQPARKSIILHLPPLTFVALTVAILNVVVAARMASIHPIIDLPQWLLPGSPFPGDASCPPSEVGKLMCTIKHDGKDIHVTYDEGRQVIVQTVISAHEYTIGELIVAWGMPASFARYGRGIDVYWGTRYAYLDTCSFQPDSHVEFIAYYREEQRASTWRGFTSDKAGECFLNRSHRP